MKIVITLLLWLIVPSAFSQAPTAPRVDHFSPQGTVKPVRQVTARFSAPMVALGDPRLADPFVIDCAAKGKGRWVDSRNWVYDFETDLESGIRCQFTPRADLRTLAGEPLRDLHPFSFDTGGPKIRATLPGEDSDTVDEQQVFLLALDGPVTADSIKA